MSGKSRKVFFSCLTGFLTMVATWFYQNYDFSFSVEDGFIKSFFTWKYSRLHLHGDRTAAFLFVNTGKDLALVNDTLDWGNVAVSDRRVLLGLLQAIDSMESKPRYTVMDIEFYYPFSPEPAVDSLFGALTGRIKNLVIPVIPGDSGNYRSPLFKAKTGYADYRTFGSGFNKFRIFSPGAVQSIPVVMDEALNHRRYEWHGWYATCDGKLCLTAVWPGYPLTNDVVHSTANPNQVKFFNAGELLLSIKADPAGFKEIFKDRILIIGNFGEDVHATPVGQMPGSVLLANIYLSLLNREQMVNGGFFLVLFLVFSGLGYLALFSKMPEVRIRIEWVNALFTRFVRSYISYFGSMVLLSLLTIALFHMQVALFLPSVIFSAIEWFRYKKFNFLKNDPTAGPVAPAPVVRRKSVS